MWEINVMINMMMEERQYDDDHHCHCQGARWDLNRCDDKYDEMWWKTIWWWLSPLQGARWDLNGGTIAESKLKELHPMMPVMYVKVISLRPLNRPCGAVGACQYHNLKAVSSNLTGGIFFTKGDNNESYCILPDIFIYRHIDITLSPSLTIYGDHADFFKLVDDWW